MLRIILCLVVLTVLPSVFADDGGDFLSQLMMCKYFNSASPLSLPSLWVIAVLSLGALAMGHGAGDLQRTDILK